MIVVFALLGLGIGWAINRAADYFPRFAVTSVPGGVTPAAALPSFALWRLINRRADAAWIKLDAAVEAGSAIFMAGLWAWTSAGRWSLVSLYLSAFLFFVLVAVIDIKYRLVLNILVYPAIIVVLAIQLLVLRNTALNVLLGGGFAFLIFYGTARVKPDGLGGGDIKLATLIGFMLGFPGVLVALIVSAGVTAVFIISLLATRHGSLKTRIAYAPFLCAGAIAALMLYPVWIEGVVLR